MTEKLTEIQLEQIEIELKQIEEEIRKVNCQIETIIAHNPVLPSSFPYLILELVRRQRERVQLLSKRK